MSKKKASAIKGVTMRAETKSPLKKMHVAPISEPKGHKPGEGGGKKMDHAPEAAAKAKVKKAKPDAARRKRNQGRS